MDNKKLIKNSNTLFETILTTEINKDAVKMVNDLHEKIVSEKEFKVEISKFEDSKEIIINYSLEKKENLATILSLAAGLPNEEFERAEMIYGNAINNNGRGYKYILEGSSFGGAFAQYAGLSGEGYLPNYQVCGLNSIGIENFLKFNGNEFLGYQLGLFYYLSKIIHGNKTMDRILNRLIDERVITYGNISDVYRELYNKRIKSGKIKAKLIEILDDELNLDYWEVESLVEENFNPLIIERKGILIDRYQDYNTRISKSDKAESNIINYITSDYIPSRMFKQTGTTYFVDEIDKMRKRASKRIDQNIINRLNKLEEDKLDDLLTDKVDIFSPFMIWKDGENGSFPRNLFYYKAQIGNISDNLSTDYLRALVKDIVLDLKKKDKEFLKKFFKKERRETRLNVLEIIKDRLRHSIKLQKKEDSPGNYSTIDYKFKSSYIRENQDLLTEDDKVYSLDQVALAQLSHQSLDLWKWDVSSKGIFIKLGTELEDGEDPLEYHSSNPEEKFTNELEKVQLKLDQPSRNIIFGSTKQVNRSESKDTDYFNKDADLYEFASNQGIGFYIESEHTDTIRTIKVANQDISGNYQEKDREEADIGSRTKTLRYNYYGDNIILKNETKINNKIAGDLIYFYGPDKEDELIITGFQNGDYGIELEKLPEEEGEEDLLAYTAHRVKFESLEFVTLEYLEVERSLYEHTRVYIRAVINEEMAKEYIKYLMKDDPKLAITYKDDDANILFKGIITEYRLRHHNFDYSLELEAKSYSILLEKNRIDRVFQNKGTTYNDVFSKLSDDNDLFKINCSDSSIGDVELVSKEAPLLLQYEENEWDFIKRLSSGLGQPLLIDDTKDDSETVNIQVGLHTAPEVKDLNNLSCTHAKKTVRNNHIFYYTKVYRHLHYRSDDIFGIGTKVNLKVDKESEDTVEMIIIKNRIYLDGGDLYSDLTLVKESEINPVKERRKVSIAGRSFRGEVKKVNTDYQAKICFKDLEDDFEEGKAHWFPINKIYKGAHFTPEVGDTVDVYLKNKDETSATVKSCTTDNDKEYDHNPADKMIVTPGGCQMKLNNEEVLFASKNDKSRMNLKEEEISMESNSSVMRMNKDAIAFKCNDSNLILDGKQIELSCGGKGMKICDGEIKLS